jgi:gamma-glutamyl hydrolase
MKQGDAGKHWPVWATCLGFESLTVVLSGGDPSVMECDFDDHGGHSVQPNENMYSSHFWGQFGKERIDRVFAKGNIYYEHNCGFTPEKLKANAAFMKAAMITSTSASTAGKTFVASIESKKYPIYGTQFHPEKNQFERLGITTLKRDLDTIKFNSDIIKFTVQGTRDHAVPLSSISGTVRKYFSSYHVPIKPGYSYYENMYMYQTYNTRNNPTHHHHHHKKSLAAESSQFSKYSNVVNRDEP